MYDKKRQAEDFLNKCRVISSFEQIEGYFVESNFNEGIAIKRGFRDDGEYQEETLESFELLEIIDEDPNVTVLNLKQAIQDTIGRKKFFIEEHLYNLMKEIYTNEYLDNIDEEDEEYEEYESEEDPYFYDE